MWAIYSLILIGFLLATGYGVRKKRRVIPILKKQESDFLLQRFGPRWTLGRQNFDSSKDQIKWHKVLRERQSSGRLSDGDGGFLYIKNDILIADHETRYWHCMLTSVEHQNTAMALTALTELRARRALFNQPDAYIAAFGVHPDKTHLLSHEEVQTSAGAKH